LLEFHFQGNRRAVNYSDLG